MRFLAMAGSNSDRTPPSSFKFSADGNISSVERRVLEAVPLLEALGNAKTLRNENSSRFGKYTELQFGQFSGVPGASLLGAQTRTYLLEKARITGLHNGERSFHIFYQVLSACREPSFLASSSVADVLKEHCMVGRSPSDFTYLARSDCVTLSDREKESSEAFDFGVTLGALRDFGVTERRVADVVGVLLAVCYLGNIVFEIDGSGGSRVKESTDEDTPLKLASRLLGVTPAALEKAFCEKRIKVMEGHVRQTRTEAQAADGRDALARHLYGAPWFGTSTQRLLLRKGKAARTYLRSACWTSSALSILKTIPLSNSVSIMQMRFFRTISPRLSLSMRWSFTRERVSCGVKRTFLITMQRWSF